MPGQPGQSVEDWIRQEADRVGIPWQLALGVAKTESGSDFNPTALGPKLPSGEQAVGTFQLLPSTAKGLGFDPYDHRQNVTAGVTYLRQLLDQYGDEDEALKHYGGVVRDTTYLPKVRANIDSFRQAQSQVGAAPPAPPGLHPHAQFGQAAIKFGKEALASLNPVTIWESIKAVPSMVAHPIDTATAMYGAQKNLYDQGAQLEAEAAKTGDYLTGLRGRLRKSEAFIPLFGPRLGEAQTFFEEGEPAKGLGALTDVAGQVAGPKLIGKGGRLRVLPPAFTPQLSRAEQAAVDLMRAENVPRDVATVSGNPFAAKLQRSAEATARGAPTAKRVFREREELLPQIGERYAGRVAHPTPVTREAAGEGLRTGSERYIQGQHARANRAYDQLRQLEADPQHTRQVQVGTTNQWTPQGTLQTVPVMGPMQLPADISAVKAQLRRVYDEYTGTVTDVARRQTSPGLTALKNLVDGPDFVPALKLERDLGAIKSLGRGADLPELKNVSQGLASYVTKSLEPVVDTALAQAGPQAKLLLTEGRQATRLKWMTEKLLKKTSEEPTQAFRKATAPKDANARYLKELATRAPSEMPKLGRALLEDLFTHGQTGVDTWEAAKTMQRRWRQIGPETRKILFPHGTDNLDALFQLHEMLGRTPNPSGTSLTNTAVSSFWNALKNPVTGGPALVFAGTIAKKMNDPAWVDLLTQGRTIGAGTPRAAAWTTAVIEQLAEAVMEEPDTQAPPPPPTTPTRGATRPPTPPVR